MQTQPNMCLYPKLILNKKYLPTKKNNYNPPTLKDKRLMYVAVGCGKCIECRTQKAREWQIRLSEELKVNKFNYFVTLTFSEENREKLCNELKTDDDNTIATIAIRRFLERYRKKYKRSCKHWLITELGHNGTERIHIHGILAPETELTNEDIANIWQYGYTFTGDYCTEKTINYIIKYVTKIDNDHKSYEPIILCSAGLGKNYLTKSNIKIHRYEPNNTKEYYTLKNGQKVNLPIYYRNKIYTEEEREKLWLEKLDLNTTYVRGIEIKNLDTEQGQKNYLDILEDQQKINLELGYGDNSFKWNKKSYRTKIKDINRKKPKNNKKNAK